MAAFDALIQAQLSGVTVRGCNLAVFEFKSGTVRLWPGFGDLVIAGDVFKGNGSMAALSTISAGVGGAVVEVVASLYGDAAIIANARADNDEATGRIFRVLFQFFDIRQFDEAGNWVEWQPIGSPLSLFVGRMAPLKVKRTAPDPARGGATNVISAPAQSVLLNRARPPFKFYSDRDQKSRTDGTDNMFLRISKYADATAPWPTF